MKSRLAQARRVLGRKRMTRVPALTAAFFAFAFAFGGSVLAAPQVTVAPFTGPGAVSLRNQVVRSVCDALDCVPAAKGKQKKGPAVLNGRAIKGKKGTTLEIWIVGTNGREKMHKPYAVTAGKLGEETLEKASKAILDAMGVKREPPPPPPEPTPSNPPPTAASNPPPSNPPPEDKKKGESDWAEPSKKDKDEPKPVDSTGEAKDAPAGTTRASTNDYKTPTILAAIHFDVLGRIFTLNNLASANMHEYRGPNLAPRLHLDSYPLTRFTDSLAKGIGLEADFSFTLGMKAVAGSESYPSQLIRFDIMAKYRYAFQSAMGLAVIPAIGYSRTSFSLSSASGCTPSAADDCTLKGLPQVAYSGLKVGLGAELPLMENKLLVGLGIYLVPVFAAGDIISPTYFQQGTVLGVDFNVGVGYRVIDNVELRLAFTLERYGLSFTNATTDTYRADGASDLYVGGTVGAAFVF
jgi:hypothetical protein